MSTTHSKKIRETLDSLKGELSKMATLRSHLCNNNFQQIFHKVYAGTAQLESMHHASGEYRNEIIDLHSKYVNKSFELFGNYYGWIPE